MVATMDALHRLKEGNRRFVNDIQSKHYRANRIRREALVHEQKPYAAILGCSDSRVPPEIIFDQGLGDLFVIRVAGNIATPATIGSIEFSVEQLGTRLVVVLGHTDCGAVQAAISNLTRPAENQSPNLVGIIDRIRPVVAELVHSKDHHAQDAILPRAVRANIRASVNQLQQRSAILKQMISGRGLMVVGAEYSLQTGKVEFL